MHQGKIWQTKRIEQQEHNVQFPNFNTFHTNPRVHLKIGESHLVSAAPFIDKDGKRQDDKRLLYFISVYKLSSK